MDTDKLEQKAIEITDADLDGVTGGEPMMVATMWTNSWCLTVVASPSNHAGTFNYLK